MINVHYKSQQNNNNNSQKTTSSPWKWIISLMLLESLIYLYNYNEKILFIGLSLLYKKWFFFI